ncbi:MAG: hypothetical protein ACERKZ_04800 [Lachnotalea sp.]
MRVNHSNVSLYAGDKINNQHTEETDASSKKKKSTTIFAGNLNLQENQVAQKRKEAQKKAMKIVGDAFNGELELDDIVKKIQTKVDTCRSEIDNAQKELNKLEGSKRELKDKYSITDDCQEQKDLELLEKRRDSFKWNSTITLTKEDNERLSEIDVTGKTEYQQRSLEIDKYGYSFRETIEDNWKYIKKEIAGIKQIEQERLKTHTIIDATKAADTILDLASKEVTQMLVNEAKDHIDNKQEDEQEEVDKNSKEEKEQKDHLEETKLKREETEALLNKKPTDWNSTKVDVSGVIPTEQIVDIISEKQDVQKEVQSIIDEMKLMAEDIKGVTVNMEL